MIAKSDLNSTRSTFKKTRKPRKGRKTAWHDKFLLSLRDNGNVRLACQIVAIDRQTAYNHRESDQLFRQQWDDAIEEAIECMEAEARRRAMRGITETVFYRGKKCGVIQKYSDTLLIFLLKAHRPEKYRERWNGDLNGTHGKPTATGDEGISFEDLDLDLETMKKILEAIRLKKQSGRGLTSDTSTQRPNAMPSSKCCSG